MLSVYVDEFIFATIKKSLCQEFSKCIHNEFAMSMMVEFNTYLDFK